VGAPHLPEVVAAKAVVPEPEIDGSLVAELRWPSGVTGQIQSSMIATADAVTAYLVVRGDRGTLVANNPLSPQSGSAELRIETAGGATVEPIAATATYWHQLVAFRDAIVHGLPFPTTAADGVRNMQVIDACYEAAGLGIRPAL
jgi:predicted dehydrogenase